MIRRLAVLFFACALDLLGQANHGAQFTRRRNTVGGSANGNRTDHYLNPVVPQNYSNAGTLGDLPSNTSTIRPRTTTRG